MGKIATLLCLLITFLSFACQTRAKLQERERKGIIKEIHVGVVLNMATSEAKVVENFISMASSDFYTIHSHYQTTLNFHIMDSKGDPLLALFAAIDLLNDLKVNVIMGALTSMEAKLLAELGDKARIPVISFAPIVPFLSSTKYPYLVQVAEDDHVQIQAIADLIEIFNWRYVILVSEDTENERDITPYLSNLLNEKHVQIAHQCVINTSYEDGHLLEEFQKLMDMETRIFVVHASRFLVSRICLIAKRLGMMNEGHAWILTAKSMNFVHLMDSSTIESMQGVIGFRSFVPSSKQLEVFTKRWRTELQSQELSAYGLWAYDVTWSLAEVAEKIMKEIASIDQKPEVRLEMIGLYNITTSRHGSIFLKELLENKFKGLSGNFQFNDGKLVSNAFELVNVIGRGDRRVGYWTTARKFTRKLCSLKKLSSTCTNDQLEAIIWPGGSATIPKGYPMQMISKKLRIGVPIKRGFKQLINVYQDNQTNTTTITGFCADVFRAAIEYLPYEVHYEFIPFVNAMGQPGSYGDLIFQVYLQNFDAVVGDITITSNRTSYVDFTIPFTDLGVGMVAKKQNEKSMWIFLKPLTTNLWLSSAAFFLFTGFVVWLIEHHINHEFQGSPNQQIGTLFWFSFSTLVSAHRERLLSNLSRFVVIVWTFVVLILTSSYTATLSSMLTIEQLQISSKEDNIIVLNQGLINNLNFENHQIHKQLISFEDYVQALSIGSKKGGASAIIDEMPYIKLFLASYSKDYGMVGSIKYTTNGFGFAFRKGSPLVSDMSKAIAKLREEGKLTIMENGWVKFQSTLESENPTVTNNNVKPLTLKSFGGLFLITGISSTLVIILYSMFLLRKKWQEMRSNLCLIREKIKCVEQYILREIFKQM